MTATIEEVKKALKENPDITDNELMEKFGVNDTLVLAATLFLLADDKQINEEEIKRLFPEYVPVKERWTFKKWIVDALRSIWKLG